MITLTTDEYIKNIMEAVKSGTVSDQDKEIIVKIEALVAALRGVTEYQGISLSGKQFHMYNADELSRIAGSLAVLKVSLGEIMAKAEGAYKLASEKAGYRKARLRKPAIEQLLVENPNKKPNNEDVGAVLEVQIYKEKTIALVLEQHYGRCLNLWRSVNSLLDVVQMRVNVLQSDRADIKYYDNTLDFDVKLRGEELKK